MKVRSWIILLLAVVVLGIWSCLKDQSSEHSDKVSLRFEPVTKVKTSQGCAQGEKDCAKVSIQYPKVTAGEPRVQEKINEVTEQKVLESMAIFSDHNQKLVVNLDSAMAEFIELYESYVTDTNYFTIPWELKIQGKVVFQSDDMVCLRLDNSSYTGGAHPNHYTTMLNFNTTTGSLLQLKDVVRDVNEFRNIAEGILLGKKEEKEELDQPLIELTSESFFMLPENFAIQEDGILLFYNPYEASDYANGALSFLISYDELKKILAEDFRLSD